MVVNRPDTGNFPVQGIPLPSGLPCLPQVPLEHVRTFLVSLGCGNPTPPFLRLGGPVHSGRSLVDPPGLLPSLPPTDTHRDATYTYPTTPTTRCLLTVPFRAIRICPAGSWQEAGVQGGTGAWGRKRGLREGLQSQLSTPHSQTGRKGQNPCLSLNEMMARNPS